MSITTIAKARTECLATLDRLSVQLAQGNAMSSKDVDEWVHATNLAHRYELTTLSDKLSSLIAKPREDAGKSISKPGTERKRQATDAFHALFIGGVA